MHLNSFSVFCPLINLLCTTMKYGFQLIVFTFLFSCGQKDSADSASKEITNDTIPLVRQNISPSAVADYSEKVKDPLNDWRFAVTLYETDATFRFLMKIEYETMNETDTITIPNFGIQPKVAIQKGESPLSCIVGFEDKEGNFMPYKKVFAENNKLRIKTIQHYARRKSLKSS